MFPWEQGQCIDVRDRDAHSGCVGWEPGSGHDFINFRARDFKGWALPLVTHADYYVDFDYDSDYTDMSVRWSEPFYIQKYSTMQLPEAEGPTVESVMLRWAYLNYRYRYEIKPGSTAAWAGAGWSNANVYDADQTLQTWYPGYVKKNGSAHPAVYGRHSGMDDRFAGPNPHFPAAPAVAKAGLDRGHPWAVSQIFREDNSLVTTFPKGELKIALNPFAGVPWAESSPNVWGDPLNYRAASDACAPEMCRLPCTRPTSAPFRWSEQASWEQLAQHSAPVHTAVDGVLVSPLTLDPSTVAWQLDADFGPPTDADTTDALRPTLELPAGFNLVVDVAGSAIPRFEKVVVGCKARLEFDVGAGVAVTLEADSILVFGELVIGTVARPWPSHLLASIVLHGHRTLSQTLVAGKSSNLGGKVLAVLGKATMVLDRPRQPSWTTLAESTAAGATQIVVEGAVPWGVGDELIVTSTDLPLYRAGTPSETGGAGSRLQLASVEGRHDEFVTVASVAAAAGGGRSVITLKLGSGERENRLTQPRYVGSTSHANGAVTMAAHVGLVHTAKGGIVVSAVLDSELEEGDDWYKGYGGHVVVTQESFKPNSQEPARTVTGSLHAYGVEFKDMGQHNSEHAAVYFAYTVDPSAAPTTNAIDSCSVQSWAAGVVLHSADDVTVTNTVVARSYDMGIEVDDASDQATITGNLIVGNYRMPTDEFTATVCGFDDSCRCVQGQESGREGPQRVLREVLRGVLKECVRGLLEALEA
jgi:hypothetical protein